MKQLLPLIAAILLLTSCTSQKKLAYLNNLPETGGEQYFPMEVPDYKLQNKDILYITAKSMNPEGNIVDILKGPGAASGISYLESESGVFLYGFDVKTDGSIVLPVIGSLHVEGKTLEEIRNMLQEEFNKKFKNAIAECKLLSFKFTVIGEVNAPGTFVNYNNYLTVLEAVGRAGGVGDYGDRNKILVVRPFEKGSRTYTLNLQDKQILSSEAYFLLPNDVVIVQPLNQKIFNMNLPTISFIIGTFTSTITMTLLLIDYFGK
jgi:polysaccharide export outer membrane protein